jgi:hypothetical protein
MDGGAVTLDSRHWVTTGERRGNHRLALHERGNHGRKMRIPVLISSRPGRGVGREAQSEMIGTGDLADQTVDRADLDARADPPRPLGKDRASGMRVGQDKNRPCPTPAISRT